MLTLKRRERPRLRTSSGRPEERLAAVDRSLELGVDLIVSSPVLAQSSAIILQQAGPHKANSSDHAWDRGVRLSYLKQSYLPQWPLTEITP